jgi:hypothetical protein
MELDFSTISPIGLIALIILCLVIGGVVVYVINSIRQLKIKTTKATVEMSKSITQAHENGANLSRDVVKKQSSIARNHIHTIAGDLRKMMYQKFNLTDKDKTIATLLVDLLVAELKFQVLNNFTENHIGNTDLEIEEYSKVREREYQAFGRQFFDSYDWIIPEHRLRDVFDEFDDDYLYKKLYVIFHDGKTLEKHIKGA